MKCTDCKYCLQEDYGYSNYTVEGTTVSCLLGKHPYSSFDRFYGEEPKLDFATDCAWFKLGNGVCIDVDRDLTEYDYKSGRYTKGVPEAYSNDPEIQELLREVYND